MVSREEQRIMEMRRLISLKPTLDCFPFTIYEDCKHRCKEIRTV